jgi:hypothetical protein
LIQKHTGCTPALSYTCQPFREWPDFDNCHGLRFAFCSKTPCAGRRNKQRAEIFNKVFPACVTVSHNAKRRSHHAVIRVFDKTGIVIETHEHAGEFKVCST